MRYLIMETHEAHAVVLDERGAFHKVVNKGYEVGQYVDEIISFDTPLEDMEKKEKILRFPVWRITAVAACLCCMLVYFAQSNLVVYGQVHMQINPDVMVSLNKQQKVLAIDALNEDGEVLLADYDYRKKTLDTVVDELTTRAEEMGFLAAEQEIHVEFISKSDTWKQETKELVTTKLDEKYEQEVIVTVEEAKEAVPESKEVVKEVVKPEKDKHTQDTHPAPSAPEDAGQQAPPQRDDGEVESEHRDSEIFKQEEEHILPETPQRQEEFHEQQQQQQHSSGKESSSNKKHEKNSKHNNSSDPTFENKHP